MSKKSLLLYSCITLLVAMGWFAYQKATDNTYEGMSIIPEEHEDIPLFEGLEPTEHEYVIDGDYWLDIYDFYSKELPKLGWNVEYEGSALNDKDPENDWSGFYSRWRKEGFNGELTVSAHYNQFEEQTEVKFDKTPIHNTTIWINYTPESICIYESQMDEKCSKVTDQIKIEEIVNFINGAIDWNEEVLPREKTSMIDFGDIKIKVLYENEEEIYFQSKKGTKLMKPDPDFFKLTNLQ
ncbi:hypothetical protein [Alkalihalobacillus sp. AL-G]|uniref:hypothetical protein n=1 Tax=Alkalihalobacillus sp. AL-G TaxID=2926399 RepID=UPI00272B5793|nr:hypothetical protein [Alkalihalobacillus sp. AL-G]WLD91725.1 hypothetical protein MOJ78_11790 [Alkalihalobacillus sp. AL-G]